MRTYLVDLENVSSYGLQGFASIDPRDEVHIFHSDKAKSINIALVKEMVESRKRVYFHKLLKPGTNAMDFQIVMLLGILIGRRKHGTYIIVSGDSGYDSAIMFVQMLYSDRDLHIYRNETIARSVGISPKDLPTMYSDLYEGHDNMVHKLERADPVNEEVFKLFSGNVGKKVLTRYFHDIVEIVSKTDTKSKLYNAMRSKFGRNRGDYIYNCIRDMVNDDLRVKCHQILILEDREN